MRDARALVGLAVGAVLLVAAGLGLASAQHVEPFVPEPGFGAGPVDPATPLTPAWSEVANDLTPGIDPTSDNACTRGDRACLDAVIAEMEARLDRLGCAPAAPFAFTYLEMTRGVQASTVTPGLFDDDRLVHQLDGLFAELYFDAFDNWEAGRFDQVPPAWQMAFGAAATGTTSAMTDLLLGMNAHISRDLSYAVADLLAAQPGGPPAPGTADRRDFDRVNVVIDDVTDPMLAGSAARFDPSIGDLDLTLAGTDLAPLADQISLDSIDSSQLIALWRTQAFTQAETLAAATTSEERLAAEAEVERNAAAIATLILNADATIDTGLRGHERTAYCEQAMADR